jgi:hypothetical protein
LNEALRDPLRDKEKENKGSRAMAATTELVFTEDQFEVLEEFTYDEKVQRSEEFRFYPLEEQLDDLIRPLLEGAGTEAVPASLMQRALRLRNLALQLYRDSTGFTPEGAPFGKRAAADPLDRLPNPDWIVPYVRGIEVLRNVEPIVGSVPDTVHMIGKPADKTHRMLLYANQVQAQFDMQRVLEPTIHAADRPSPVDMEVVYDGVIPFNEASASRPAYSLKAATKSTRLLPAYIYQRSVQQNNGSILTEPQVIYPAERQELRGWIVLPPGDATVVNPRDVVAGLIEGVLVDPPATNMVWFQSKPVLLREWRDLWGNRPSVEEVLRQAPEQKPGSLLEEYLAYYGLRMSDIPWSLWNSILLPKEEEVIVPYDPEAESEDNETKQKETRNKKREEKEEEEEKESKTRLLPTHLYGPYPPGLSVLAWLSSQPDGGQWVRATHSLQALAADPGTASGSSLLLIDHALPADLKPTTVQECLIDVSSWREFRGRGVFQPDTRLCLPLDIVKRKQLIRRTQGRLAISEVKAQLTTHLQWLEALVRRDPAVLAAAAASEATSKAAPIEARIEKVTESQKRVRALLDHPEMPDSQKATLVTALLSQLHAEGSPDRQWRDPVDKAILVCQHTLSLLALMDSADADEGAMESFYSEWTFTERGARVCQYCGQQVSKDVWDTSFEYTEDGFLDVTRSELVPEAAAGPVLLRLTDTERMLRAVLRTDERADGRILFYLLTMLGIEPHPQTLQRFVESGFAQTDAFVRDRNLPKGGMEAVARAYFGVALFVLLLKTHSPMLRPTRRLDRFAFSLEGYPRSRSDADSTTSPILSYVLGTLGYAFKNGLGAAIKDKDVLHKPLQLLSEEPARVRAFVIQFIKVLLTQAPDTMVFLNETPDSVSSAAADEGTLGLEAAARQETAAGYGAWLYGRILHHSARLLEPRTAQEGMPDRIAEAFAEVEKKVEALRGPLRALPRLMSPPLRVPFRVGVDQDPLILQIAPSLIAQTQKTSEAASSRRGATTDAAVEKQLRILQQGLTHKGSIGESLAKTRPDVSPEVRSAYELRILQGVLRFLYRVFVGTSVHNYSERTLNPSASDKLRQAVRETDLLLSDVPVRTEEAEDAGLEAALEELVWTATLSLDTARIHIDLQLDVARVCTGKAIELVRSVFGKEAMEKVLHKAVEWEREVYRFSADDIAAQLLKQRSRERQVFRERLGEMDDTTRAQFTDMMALGLRSAADVFSGADRSAMADALLREEQESRSGANSLYGDESRSGANSLEETDGDDLVNAAMPFMTSSDNDDAPGFEAHFDRGDYGDLANGYGEDVYASMYDTEY